jgi:tRNA threonylcarbamoyladenosine biosynthesis protein TsaE
VSTLRAVTGSGDETITLAARVGELLLPGDVVVLAGDLGSGKTTFAKGIGRGLGVTEPIVSPTFTIVREYEGRVPLVHVDVYRLDHVQELHDLGLEELAGDDAVTMVEWGDVVGALLPQARLEVRLDPGAHDDERRITLVPTGSAWQRRSAALAGAVGGAGAADAAVG